MSSGELNKLHIAKRAFTRSIRKIRDQVDTYFSKPITPEIVCCIEAGLDENQSSLNDLKDTCLQILSLLDHTDQTADQIMEEEAEVFKEYENHRGWQWRSAGKLKTLKTSVEGSPSRQSILNQSVRETNINAAPAPKFPDIPVPKFDGELKNFTNWHALFENMFHQNDRLEPVQKLYYLKSAMEGKASHLLADFPLTNDAYQEAWSFVKNRFYNKRAIIGAHFRTLNSLPVIKSDSEIRAVLDQVNVTLRGLKICDVDVDNAFSSFVTFIVVSKLEPKLREDWENSIPDNTKYPSFKEISTFLQNRSFAFEGAQSGVQSDSITDHTATADKPTSYDKGKKKTTLVASSHATQKCAFCNGTHFSSYCEKFLAKSTTERLFLAKKASLCTNCLKPGHKPSECRSSLCRQCGKAHHTLLHHDQAKDQPIRDSKGEEKSSANTKTTLTTIRQNKACLLPSAVVYVLGTNSKLVKARMLLDNCSEANLISESFVRRNRFPTTKKNSVITGITNDALQSNRSTRITIKSRINDFQIVLDADIIPTIPYRIDSEAIHRIAGYLQCIPLADGDYAESEEVDLVLGVEYVNLCLMGERKFFDGICCENSQFGWILSGAATKLSNNTASKYCQLISEVNEQIARFWEVENIESTKPIAANFERESCVAHFEENTKRMPDGSFSVSLPFKRKKMEVADTFRNALAALKRCEKIANDQTREMYRSFMAEYLALGHMQIVPPGERADRPAYYLPHHAVLRPSSTTTKLRVVFNASAKNTTGCSLNEALMVGPCIQPDLFDILISFRRYEIAFTADVTKMYRCVSVDPKDRDMQRILWRDNTTDTIQHYRLITVTYGTASASFLATKCLEVLANSIENAHPAVASAIKTEFYMDDLLTGSANIESALNKLKLIHETLASAGFPLTKYASNSPRLLEIIESRLVDKAKIVSLEAPDAISTLGVEWKPSNDELSIKVRTNDCPHVEPLTKRAILSLISRVFDPLGLIAPVTVRAKILMQNLWREELGWDDPAPASIISAFHDYAGQLPELRKFSVPRSYSAGSVKDRFLIGFSDASSKASCAAIYVKSVCENGEVSVALVCSKTQVAPIKSVTIPRLELIAAVNLTKLMVRVNRILKLPTENLFAYCDSTIVLSWLKSSSPDKLEAFVRNRVSFVETELPGLRWAHVKTDQNPADLGTRGISAQSLVSSNYALWTTGPPWLRESLEYEESFVCAVSLEPPSREPLSPEIEESFVCAVSLEPPSYEPRSPPEIDISAYLNRYSSFVKLLRVTTYVYRFIDNCKVNKTLRNLKSPSGEELCLSFRKLIAVSQLLSFRSEIQALNANQSIHRNSRLISLNPFLDSNNILRAHGRLAISSYSYDVKFPMILDAKSNLLNLYVAHLHNMYYHATKSFVVNAVRSRFFVVGGLPKLVKKVIAACILCTKLKAKSCSQLMGSLPMERSQVNRAFTNTGVDFAGPFRLKCTNHRAVKFNKIYAAFFTCFSTKAVHIEIVPDLTTDAFLSALDRFVSRRGCPARIFSDNGSNFIGAKSVISLDKVTAHAAGRSITWSFIPPGSPHFGGLWEAAVKSGKSLLLKAIGEQILNYDEFVSVFTKVEAILNSRPLCKIRIGEEFEPLTPSHFLIGSSVNEIPIEENHRLSLTRRFRMRQAIVNSFWKTYVNNYIAQLHPRQKWKRERENLKVDDIVIMRKANSPVLQWPIGRVSKTFPDREGLVRCVEVATSSGTYRRAITGVVKLPVNHQPADSSTTAGVLSNS